jgi:hypothetical protein
MVRCPLAFLFAIPAALPAFAQGYPPWQCIANTVNPPLMRFRGIAERAGDILITCQGGDPAQVNLITFQVNMQTPITSRVLNPFPAQTGWRASEALLLVDEPGADRFDPATGNPLPPIPPVACSASLAGSGNCPPGANVYQGYQAADNSVIWVGVPLVPTGVAPPRTFRLTNLRANVSVASMTPGWVPTMLNALVVLNGTNAPPLANASQVVGFVQEGIMWSLRTPDNSAALGGGGAAFQPCVAHNEALSLNPASGSAPDGGAFVVRVREGYGTALLKQAESSDPPVSAEARPAYRDQKYPSHVYNSENGFIDLGYPIIDGMKNAGVASHATRFSVMFRNVPHGLQFHAPVYELGRNSTNSRVRLVAAEPSPPASLTSPYTPLGPASAGLGTYYTKDMTYVYEVTAKGNVEAWALDSIDLLFYAAHPGKPYVGWGTASVSVHLSPVSNAAAASEFDWIPRFAESSEWRTAATMNPCSPQAKLTASLGTRSGPASARIWPVVLRNVGLGAATNAQATGLSLKQTYGAACTPVVITPMPVAYGGLAVGASQTRSVTVNFTGCPAAARFSATIQYAAGGGAGGSSTYHNLYR